MNAVIVVGNNVSPSLAKATTKDCFVFGADQGAAYCLKNDIRINVAVGDFDSVSEEEKTLIKAKAARYVELPVHKDDTDTARALMLAGENFASITILGGIAGDRIEHFIANVALLRKKPNNLFLEDDDSLCFALSNGVVEVKSAEAEYVSLFALDDAKISLVGFEYPLEHHLLVRGDPLGVSNRLKEDKGQIHVESGLLLVIYHRKKQAKAAKH